MYLGILILFNNYVSYRISFNVTILTGFQSGCKGNQYKHKKIMLHSFVYIDKRKILFTHSYLDGMRVQKRGD